MLEVVVVVGRHKNIICKFYWVDKNIINGCHWKITLNSDL